MKLDVLIPQIWYDFIGRVIPGTYILSYCFLAIYSNLDNAIFKFSFMGLVFAYLIGALIGALFHNYEGKFINWLNKRFIKLVKDDLSVLKETKDVELVRAGINEEQVRITLLGNTDLIIPFIYDLIHIKFPKMGARISKLRSEQLLCGTLFVSSIPLCIFSLVIIFCFRHTGCLDIALPFIAITVFVLAFLLYKHLRSRYYRAIIDGWLLVQIKIKEV